MKTNKRPIQSYLFVLLLLSAAGFMVLLAMSASAYYYSAGCLLLQAVLVWSGVGFKPFNWIMILNQLSGVLLIVVLCIGDVLHLPKLDIAGVMLLIHVFTGGPLMSILALPMMASIFFQNQLPIWFGAYRKKIPGLAYNLPHWE